MTQRNSEKPHADEISSREFYLREGSSRSAGAAIEVVGAAPVSERAKSKFRAQAGQGQGSTAAWSDVSASFLSRKFYQREKPEHYSVAAILSFFSKPVSERAAQRRVKSINHSPLTSNKLVEGTPPRCALLRPSPARWASVEK